MWLYVLTRFCLIPLSFLCSVLLPVPMRRRLPMDPLRILCCCLCSASSSSCFCNLTSPSISSSVSAITHGMSRFMRSKFSWRTLPYCKRNDKARCNRTHTPGQPSQQLSHSNHLFTTATHTYNILITHTLAVHVSATKTKCSRSTA